MSSSQWKSPWLSMSNPARSWSLATTAMASWDFSQKRTSSMQVSKGLPRMLTSNHRGRGQDPVTVLGSMKSWVTVDIQYPSPCLSLRGTRPQGEPSLPRHVMQRKPSGQLSRAAEPPIVDDCPAGVP
jgi:hypothetical protein